MDLTPEFEALTRTRGTPRSKRYSPLDDVTSLRTKINKMKSHLKKYGHDYLDTYGYLPGASIMTDDWRNKLDQDIEEFISICNEKKGILQSETRLDTTSQQVIEHRESVIEILTHVLNDFNTMYIQLRTTRMSRNFQKQKYDRIETKSGSISPIAEPESILNDESLNLESLTSQNKDDMNVRHPVDTAVRSRANLTEEDFQRQSIIAAEHHTSISPDEIQVLALENSIVHEELMTLDDEVKLIGKKVVQISRLQELLTEKVMEQECELNNLHEAALRSSENVREGNELIRDAMMKNASTRVFILFYIVTLGFTILFLDWYNP